MPGYEEKREFPRGLGWALLILLVISIIAWCMTIMMFVQDRPREWDFGQLPDVPAQSIYSTLPPPETPDMKKVPQNMPTLPEAQKSQEGYETWTARKGNTVLLPLK